VEKVISGSQGKIAGKKWGTPFSPKQVDVTLVAVNYIKYSN
jgi:hypothetical protein